MALSTKLELRQGQQLVMTPQLQQAIRLLQLSNMELTEFVDTELERNPLLEREEADEAPSAPQAEPPTKRHAPRCRVRRRQTRRRRASRASRDERRRWLDLGKPVADPAAALDTEFDNVFPDTATGDPDLASDASRHVELGLGAPAISNSSATTTATSRRLSPPRSRCATTSSNSCRCARRRRRAADRAAT